MALKDLALAADGDLYINETGDFEIIDVVVTILDSLLGGKAKDDKNFCGGTGAMLSFAPDGSAYPCIRYAPISIGVEKAKKVRFGSVYDGLYVTDEQKRVKADQRYFHRLCVGASVRGNPECGRLYRIHVQLGRRTFRTW